MIKKLIKIMAVSLFMIGCTIMVTPVYAEEVKYRDNENLTSEQIEERFNSFSSKYELNEPFSEMDSEFVKLYADNMNNQQGIAPIDYNSQTGKKNFDALGIYGTFSWTIFVDSPSGGLTGDKYGGNLNFSVYANNYVRSITITMGVSHQVYGIIGGSGTYVGLISDTETSQTFNTNTTNYYASVSKEVGYFGGV